MELLLLFGRCVVLLFWMLLTMTSVPPLGAAGSPVRHQRVKFASFDRVDKSRFKNSAQDAFQLPDALLNATVTDEDQREFSGNLGTIAVPKPNESFPDVHKRVLTTGSVQSHYNNQLKSSSLEKRTEAGPRSRMPYGLSKGLQDIRQANNHYLKVHNQAGCKLPKARIVKVKDIYPDQSKEYLPSCTILHKCGEDTGCCESSNMHCLAKTKQVVELYFYKLHLNNSGDSVSINTVEKLVFENDTECECKAVDNRPRFHVGKSICLQCPSGFNLREPQKGVCACDCFDKQKSCLKMKRGREPLSDVDRRCVDGRRCHQPECEYGLYDSTIGRCPRKHERRNIKNNSGWWRFDERE